MVRQNAYRAAVALQRCHPATPTTAPRASQRSSARSRAARRPTTRRRRPTASRLGEQLGAVWGTPRAARRRPAPGPNPIRVRSCRRARSCWAPTRTAGRALAGARSCLHRRRRDASRRSRPYPSATPRRYGRRVRSGARHQFGRRGDEASLRALIDDAVGLAVRRRRASDTTQTRTEWTLEWTMYWSVDWPCPFWTLA